MKLRTIFTLSLAATAFSCFTVQAQEGAPAAPTADAPATSDAAASAAKPDNADKAALREKIKAARKAAASDPAVVQARDAQKEAFRSHREAERAAIIAKDPAMADVLRGPRGPKKEKPEGEAKGEKRQRPDRAQYEKLRELRKEVASDPTVKAADEKKDAAHEAYVTALKAALSKADPSLSAEAVDKLAERMSKPHRGGKHGKHGKSGG